MSGGNRDADLLRTSLSPYQLRQIWVASPSIQERLLHRHPSPATQIQTPKSKNQMGCLDVWILEFGSWILDLGVWILDLGFWYLDFGCWILVFGFWILDFGAWIVVVSILSVAAPSAAVWILDFGFWPRFWILHKIIATTRRLGSADSRAVVVLTRLNYTNDIEI